MEICEHSGARGSNRGGNVMMPELGWAVIRSSNFCSRRPSRGLGGCYVKIYLGGVIHSDKGISIGDHKKECKVSGSQPLQEFRILFSC